MRRGFASMLMGLSLIVGSAGWAGMVFVNNVLDDDQTEELSRRLMGHEAVRTVLVGRLSDGIDRHIPGDEPMSRQDLRTVAAEALADPLAATALRDGLSDAHLSGLADEEPDLAFSSFDVNEAVRHALIDARPTLKDQILVNPLVKVELPVRGLAWFSGLTSLVDRFAILAIALACIGFATTFVVAEESTVVLQRAAWWLLGSAIAWLVVGPVFAAIVRFTVPSSYIVSAAALEISLQMMRNPAIIMASFGLGMLSVSYLAPAIGRRRGALLLDQAKDKIGYGSSGLVAASGGLDSAQSTSSSADSLALTVAETKPASATTAEATTAATTTVGSGVASRLSAAWIEDHGYLDDARVAPFVSPSGPES